MKKFFILSLFIGLIASNAQALEVIKLPKPQIDTKATLYDALKNRKSVRTYEKKDLDMQTLSNILWVAYGVNRDDGRRTIPTARNAKDLSVYVANKDGVWLYKADENELKQMTAENIMYAFGTQSFMKDVPVVLIYAGSDKDHNFSVMHAGSAYQNVELYAGVTDLGCVVRAMFDKEAVTKAIQLPAGQRVIVTQAIGYEKE
ncbi:MAG: nitroreductase family protein [Alphaproteobacteria bacterium]|nr:nitroreductase family protein [Alphaproteobacteria bacterium]